MCSEVSLTVIQLNTKEKLEEYSSYLHDESKLTSSSAKELFFPKSTKELSNYLAGPTNKTSQFVVSGARTGLTGGAVPITRQGETPSSIISLDRLKQIIAIEPRSDNRYLRVQSGATLLQALDYLKENAPEYFLPVDPTERSASFGGMISTNAGGARSFRYGTIRSWVEEITVVLATGEIVEIKRNKDKLDTLPQLLDLNISAISKPKVKNAIGPDLSPEMDLIDLFIGSEGIYGIVTEAVLRLERIPKVIVGFLQFFKDESLALDFVSNLRTAFRPCLMSIEFFDEVSINYALKSIKSFGSKISLILEQGANRGVFFELDLDFYGSELDKFLEEYINIVSEIGVDLEHCVIASEISELEDIKAFRHAVPEQINATIANRKKIHPTLRKVATDMAVPDQALKAVVNLYREKFSSKNLEFAIFGHVGDNHLHVNVLPQDDSELKKALEAYKEIAHQVVKMGGAVSAEHGIGRIKKDFFMEQFSKSQIDQLKKIKKALDPDLKLNIGVLFDM